MASIRTASHLPALRVPHAREQAGGDLEQTAQELIGLALVAKQLHWTVVGPLFRPLHQQFDELSRSWHELADVVAERAATLGHMPNGQATAVAGVAGDPVEVIPIEGAAAVWEITRRLSQVSERTRERMDRLGELDLASQDTLTGVVRALEQHQWMLRVQLGESVADVYERGRRIGSRVLLHNVPLDSEAS